MKKALLILALAGLVAAGCGEPAKAPPPQAQAPVSLPGPVLQVLFIGNSYTSVNGLPQVFTQLAASGKHAVQADMVAPGGYTLAQHAAYPDTLSRIKSRKWDDVVLQDQSFMPALEKGRAQEMDPGARTLAGLIRDNGSRPMFYLTWGRQKGLPEQGFSDFAAMQAQLTQGYMDIAQELKIPVAPVGEAWKTALSHDSSVPLWGPDGSHPSVQGTYLAACVFYAAIYGQNPEGLDYTAGLPKETAFAMQVAATETVLADKGKWQLP